MCETGEGGGGGEARGGGGGGLGATKIKSLTINVGARNEDSTQASKPSVAWKRDEVSMSELSERILLGSNGYMMVRRCRVVMQV
jgi:hypothetical protein